MTNVKLKISRILIGRGIAQFCVFLGIAASFLLLLWVIGLLLGFSLFEVVLSYIAPGNSWRLEGEVARAATADNKSDWYLPIVGFIGAVIFTGLLVSVFTNIVQYWVTRIREGHVSYNLQDHYVIIGYDAIVPTLVKQIFRFENNANTHIIVSSQKPVSEIRNTILSKLGKNQERKVVYMHSEHFSEIELSRLNTHQAKQIFVVGDRIEGNRDAENMRLMLILKQIHSNKNTKRIPLTMWFDNETSYAAMQLNDIKDDWKSLFDYRPYNFYNDWADRLLVSRHYHKGDKIIEYPALDRDGIRKDSNQYVHLVVIGMNRMGVAVAKEAAHMLHFPNFDDNIPNKNQTVITFIDDHADTEMAFFKGRHPGYFKIAPSYYWDAIKTGTGFINEPSERIKFNQNFLDVKFQFLKGRIESEIVKNWLIEQAKDPNQYLTIAVCLTDSTNALGAAFYLPEEIYYGNADGNQVNIFVRQESTGALVEMLQRASESGKNQRLADIYPFGMIDNSFDFKELDNTVAQIMNYIYDYDYNNHCLPTSIPPKVELDNLWKDVSISNQWSNLYLADSLTFKLRSIGYDMNSGLPLEMSQGDKDRMARVEHNRWNMEKLLIGYRALTAKEESEWSNEKKKEVKKTRFIHHDICPYDDLQCKDQQNDKNIIEALPMVLGYMKEHGLLHHHLDSR